MTQKSVSVIFSALGLDKVKAGVDDATASAKKFAGTYTAKLTADDKNFRTTIATDLKQAQTLGKAKIVIKATVDNGDAETKMREMQAEADKLGLKRIVINMSTSGEGKTLLTLGATNSALDVLGNKGNKGASALSSLGSSGSGAAASLSQMVPILGSLAPSSGVGGLAIFPVVAVAIGAVTTELTGLVAGLSVAAVGAGAFAALAYPAIQKVVGALGDSNKGLKKESQPVQEAVQGIRSLKTEYDQMSASFAPDVFKVFNSGLSLIHSLLPDIAPFATTFADSIGTLIGHLNNFTNSGPFLAWITEFHSLEGPAIGAIGAGIGRLAATFGKLLTKLPPKDVVNAINIGFSILSGTISALTGIVGFSMRAWDSYQRTVIDVKNASILAFDQLNNAWFTTWHAMWNVFNIVTKAVQNAFGIAVSWIVTAFKGMWTNGLEPVLRTFVNTFLDVFGAIIHGAATAFGWIPGIGGKLKTAASQFDQFRDNVNAALGGLNNKQVNVKVGFQPTPSGNDAGNANVFTKPMAAGGMVHGPGTGTSDTAGLFALSHGEHVTKAKSVKKYGTPAMNAVNDGRAVIGYAGGGQVGVNVSAQTPSSGSINNGVNGVIAKMAQTWASTVGSLSGVAAYANSFLGQIPYVWGGTSVPGGADCSGFVQAVYKHFGISAPRTSEAQFDWAKSSDATPGGMAFYISPAGGPPPGHVAIVKDANTVISQGGGMGPQLMGMHAMPLMGLGVPPGGVPGGGGSGGNGAANGSLQETAQGLLNQFGWGNQWGSFNNIENREAGWNMSAQNPSSGAYGLAQFINGPSEYAQYGGSVSTGLGQLTAMMEYIGQRYGDPNNAWGHEEAFGWYANGTNNAKRGFAMVGERGPEIVGFGGGERVIPNHKLGGNAYQITVNVPVGANPSEVGRQTVNAIKAFEQRSGSSWRS